MSCRRGSFPGGLGEGGDRRGRPGQLESTRREAGRCLGCPGTANTAVAWGGR